MSPAAPADDFDLLYLLTDGFGGHGGIALYNRDMLKALGASELFERIVAVPRIAGPFEEPVPPGIDWQEQAAGSVRTWVCQALRSAWRSRKGAPVFAAHINLLPVAALAKAITGGPLVLALYGTEAWSSPSSPLRRWALRFVDEVYAISEVTRSRFLAWSGFDPAHTVLFPNAIHLECYGEGPRDGALARRLDLEPDNGPRLLIFGRMHPTERQKGFDELLEALPLIRERHPGAIAILAGEGGDRPRLERKAAELGLVNHVRFTGMVDEADKAELYRLADVYVMPSYQEGFGYVHLEAMACGTPSVASDLDGAREAVREGMIGEVIDPHDPASIARGVNAALARGRGIPDGLGYFAWPAFANRVRSWVARLKR